MVPAGVLVHIQQFSIFNGLISVPELCVQVDTMTLSFAVKAKAPEIHLGPLTISAAMANICPVRDRNPIICGGEINAVPAEGPSFEMDFKTLLNPPFFSFNSFISGSIQFFGFRVDVCAVISSTEVTINAQLVLGDIKFLLLFTTDYGSILLGGLKVELLARLDIGASGSTLSGALVQVVEDYKQSFKAEYDNALAELDEARQDLLAARANLKRRKYEARAARDDALREVNDLTNRIRHGTRHCDDMSWFFALAKIACYASIKVLETALTVATRVALAAVAVIQETGFFIEEAALAATQVIVDLSEVAVGLALGVVDVVFAAVSAVIEAAGTVLDVKDFEFYMLLDSSADVGQSAPRVRFKLDAIVFGLPVDIEFEAEVCLTTNDIVSLLSSPYFRSFASSLFSLFASLFSLLHLLLIFAPSPPYFRVIFLTVCALFSCRSKA